MYISVCVGSLTTEQLKRETHETDDSQLATRIRQEDVLDRGSGFTGSSPLVSVNTSITTKV